MDPELINLLKARMTRHLPMSITEDD
jgi:hypothetical protein